MLYKVNYVNKADMISSGVNIPDVKWKESPSDLPFSVGDEFDTALLSVTSTGWAVFKVVKVYTDSNGDLTIDIAFDRVQDRPI